MADGKIDVHAHFIPEVYREALLENGFENPDGMPGIPEWSAEAHLAYMDATNIQLSILSISSPGTNLSTSTATANARLTRLTNEATARLKRQHPTRFGFFASLPIDPASDPELLIAKAEIAYALDELDADGFVLMSNVRGVYLGDGRMRPLLEELDRRGAVVFVHPTCAEPCHYGCGVAVEAGEAGDQQQQQQGQQQHERHDQQKGQQNRACTRLSAAERYQKSSPLAEVYRAPIFEFFFDSGRTFLDLIMSGCLIGFPRIRWIVSHAGGVLPSVIDRIFLILHLNQPFTTNPTRPSIPTLASTITEPQIRHALRTQMWFDLAGNPVPNMVDALLRFTSKERLLFGSDVPWTPFEVTKGLVGRMERELGRSMVGEEGVEGVWKGNAEVLFGKWGK